MSNIFNNIFGAGSIFQQEAQVRSVNFNQLCNAYNQQSSAQQQLTASLMSSQQAQANVSAQLNALQMSAANAGMAPRARIRHWLDDMAEAIINDELTEDLIEVIDTWPTWFMDLEDRLPDNYHEIDSYNYDAWQQINLEHDLIISNMTMHKIGGKLQAHSGMMLVRIKNDADNTTWKNVKQIMAE